jgi:GDP/UDP-N,N'-diacetylbacillosamine 2-epimerase (hydrolysing)
MRYFSCIQHCDGVVGNSSSGLLEVPSFRKGTVNIGDRQKGRLRTASVLQAEPEIIAIQEAIKILLARSFQRTLDDLASPCVDESVSSEIIAVLAAKAGSVDVSKRFFLANCSSGL